MTPDIQNEPKPSAVPVRELPATLQPLEELSWNYWWSWAPDGLEVFHNEDRGLWRQCEQNPRLLLNQVTDLRLSQMAADPDYAARVQKLHERFSAYMSDSRPWPKLQLKSYITPQTPVAYFCAEFGVHECLPLYSGGLGVLAGDHLKSASDLNLPLVAVGLVYRQGYFHQIIDADGMQHEEYPPMSPLESGFRLATDLTGRPAQVCVPMDHRELQVRVWRTDVGRVPLFLLDTDLDENAGEDRFITSHLYGGDREMRIRQEILLGIGGLRALRVLGYDRLDT